MESLNDMEKLRSIEHGLFSIEKANDSDGIE